MFISRRKYERDLDRAYKDGFREAEERCAQEKSFERVWKKLNELEERLRGINPHQKSRCNEADAQPPH